MMYISFETDDNKKSLVDQIKELPKIRAPKKKPMEVIDDEPIILTKSSGKKKKKKKNKVSNLEVGAFADIINSDSDEETEETELSQSLEEKELIDILDLLNDDDDDNIGNSIIDEQRRGYEKRKKDDNPYKKEFAEELTLLYDLLDEVNTMGKDLDKKYKSLESSKVRGISKYVNDMMINMISTKSSKLSIIKEINSLKKNIADLKLKSDIKDNKSSSENNPDLMATQYFQKVLGYGRSNFIENMTKGSDDGEEEIDSLVSSIDNRKGDYSSIEIDNYQRMLEDRLEDEGNPRRTDGGSKYIEYEERDVKIWVKRCIDTGEWKFIALDRDNQEIFGYPLPDRNDIGKMTFADKYATDQRGRSYKLIEFFSDPDFEEDDNNY